MEDRVMSYNSDFLEAPLEFINNYAIRPMEGVLRDDNGKKIVTGRFSLVPTGYQPGGKAKAVLSLVEDEGGFEAYWLAYDANKSKRAILGNASKYMFTTQLSGCSFGWGSKTGTGEILVAHSNAANIGAYASERLGDEKIHLARKIQADAQRRMLTKKMLKGTLKVWNPYEYADPFHGGKGAMRKDVIEYVATIIGIRTTQWDFYCQRRVLTTDLQFVLRDVIKLT
jgi:hypothetical protein